MNMAQPRQLYAGLVFSGHVCIWPVNALAASQLQVWALPSDPSREARNAFFRGSAKLTGALLASAVGLTTRPDGEPKVPLRSG